jgi:hypothetical protein
MPGLPREKASGMRCYLTLMFGTILGAAVQRRNGLCQLPLAQPGHVTLQWTGLDPSPHSMLKLYLCMLASPKRSPRLAVLVTGGVHGLGWPWQPSAGARAPMQHCNHKAADWAGTGAGHHPLATPLVHLTSGMPHFRLMGGWAERWHTGLLIPGVSPSCPYQPHQPLGVCPAKASCLWHQIAVPPSCTG